MKLVPPCLAAIALLLPHLSAQTELQVDWGTSAVPEKMILSDGTAMDLGDFTIQIGTFSSGFIPTDTNVHLWAANWIVFDAITTPDADPNDFTDDPLGVNAKFQGSANLDAAQTSDSEDAIATDVFAEGAQAYVWVYNQLTFDTNTEWALYTNTSGGGIDAGDAWTFPDADAGQTQSSLSWQISEADTAVLGAVGGDGGTTDTGGGGYTDSSTNFILRTHVPEPIPEPTAALLAGLGGLLLLRRKRC